jgi:hypothetical protein
MTGSTSKFEVIRIVFDNGEFAIAEGYWEKQKHLSLACRWYSVGNGFPQSYGKPQWLVFPEELGDILLAAINLRNKVCVA